MLVILRLLISTIISLDTQAVFVLDSKQPIFTLDLLSSCFTSRGTNLSSRQKRPFFYYRAGLSTAQPILTACPCWVFSFSKFSISSSASSCSSHSSFRSFSKRLITSSASCFVTSYSETNFFAVFSSPRSSVVPPRASSFGDWISDGTFSMPQHLPSVSETTLMSLFCSIQQVP